MLENLASSQIPQPVLRGVSTSPAALAIALEKIVTRTLSSLRGGLAARRSRRFEGSMLSGLSDHLRHDVGLEPQGIDTLNERPRQNFSRLWSLGV